MGASDGSSLLTGAGENCWILDNLQDTVGRRIGREEPKYIEISDAPWTSEIWIQLLSRQRKLKAMGPPESQPSGLLMPRPPG